MAIIRVDPQVYGHIRDLAESGESANRALRRHFDLGDEPLLQGAAAERTAPGSYDFTGDGIAVAVPADAPWRDEVKACWVADGRLFMEYR